MPLLDVQKLSKRFYIHHLGRDVHAIVDDELLLDLPDGPGDDDR